MEPIRRVRDVMTSPAVEVKAETALREVAELLDEHEVGALVVVGPDGMQGMVSERDVVRTVAEGGDLDAVWASDVMATEPSWVTPEDTVEDAARAMANAWARHLPVLDEDGEVCGVVSVRDVLLAISD